MAKRSSRQDDEFRLALGAGLILGAMGVAISCQFARFLGFENVWLPASAIAAAGMLHVTAVLCRWWLEERGA